MLFWTFLSSWVTFWCISYPLNFICNIILIFIPCIFSIWMLFTLSFILSSAFLFFALSNLSSRLWLNLW
jgi:hypothetical protein